MTQRWTLHIRILKCSTSNVHQSGCITRAHVPEPPHLCVRCKSRNLRPWSQKTNHGAFDRDWLDNRLMLTWIWGSNRGLHGQWRLKLRTTPPPLSQRYQLPIMCSIPFCLNQSEVLSLMRLPGGTLCLEWIHVTAEKTISLCKHLPDERSTG